MRTWWENESILNRFREWLAQTGREAAEWSPEDDTPEDDLTGPESDLEQAPLRNEGRGQEQEDESLTDAFASQPDPREWRAEPLPEVGLLQLLEAFTALRHELKLQTKSARGLEESVRSALQGLDDASRQFKSVQSREREAADRAIRPYVESLIAWHEAVGRGIQAFVTTHRQATTAGTRRLRETLDEQFARLPKWRQWLARSWHTEVTSLCAASFGRLSEDDFRGVTQGFTLIQSRLDRSLKEHEIQRIECAGRRVDPTEMTVVELVDDPQAAPETVVEEIRPGYSWRGQVLRFAEVRAVRGTPGRSSDPG